MNAMPNTMKLGMALAFVGAIVAFAAMAMAWDGTTDCAALVGIDMAVAMIFFATAGCFSAYSPVKGSTVVVLSALTIAFSVIATFYGGMEIYVGILLVILGAICVFCGNLSSTKDYVDANRVI